MKLMATIAKMLRRKTMLIIVNSLRLGKLAVIAIAVLPLNSYAVYHFEERCRYCI